MSDTSSVPARGGVAARLRLVRRAASVLLPLENADVLADVENQPLGSGEHETRLLRTDLMITASDLRVRVATLPGGDAAALASDDVLHAALFMLLETPETSAVVVVADDKDLTARLVEPADEPNAVQASVAPSVDEPGERFGPLSQVVRTYLRQVTAPWDNVTPLAATREDFRAEAREIAAAALMKLQSKRKNTPEWRAARSSLDARDAEWAASLSIRLRLEAEADVVALLESQARGGKIP